MELEVPAAASTAPSRWISPAPTSAVPVLVKRMPPALISPTTSTSPLPENTAVAPSSHAHGVAPSSHTSAVSLHVPPAPPFQTKSLARPATPAATAAINTSLFMLVLLPFTT